MMNLRTRLLQPNPAARRLQGLTVAFGALASLLVVAQALLLSRVVAGAFLRGQALADLLPTLLALALLALARAGLAWASELSAQRMASLVKLELRARLAEHVLALGPAYTGGERSGELAHTLGEGVEALDEYLARYLPQVALAGLAPLIVLVLVFPLDWLSGLVLLITAPIIPVFMVLIGGMAKSLTERQWSSLSRMSAHFLDALQGLTTLKQLGRSREQALAIGQVSARFGQATMQVLRVAFLSALVLELTASLSTAVVAVEVSLRLLRGGLLFEQALAVLILAPEFYLPLRMLGARHHASMAGVEAARRIFTILDTSPSDRNQAPRSEHHSVVPGAPALRSTSSVPPRPFDIRFEDVHFAYDGGARPALRGLSATLGAGELVALVGPSGAGKSTLAQLLLRFAEPDRGRILVGGRPLAAIDLAEWRAQVAWVPQRPYLLPGSVAENLRLGRPGATLAELIEAAQAAGAHEFIAALPQGYDTPIGEGGARLSGGQAQRLALARALLSDAPLLILDEPTAHLDRASARAIRAAIERQAGQRTVLLIAHQPELAAGADRVVRLEDGRVAREERPPELLASYSLSEELTDAVAVWEIAPLADGVQQTADSKQQIAGTRHQAAEHSQAAGFVARVARLTPRNSLGRLLALVAPLSWRFGLAALLGFATVASSIGLIATSAYLISAAALMPSIAALQVAIVGVRFFGIARGLLRYAERYTAHAATFRLIARLRAWFYRAVEPLAPAGLQSLHSGDLLARAVGDIGTLEQFYLRAVAPPLVALLTSGLAALLLGWFSAWLAASLLLALALGGVGLPLLAQRLSQRPGEQIVAARAELSAALVGGVQGAADLLAFGAGARFVAELVRIGAGMARAQERLAAARGMHAALIGLLASWAGLAALALAIPLVRAGQIDGVYLALIGLTAMAAFEALVPLGQAAEHLSASAAAARRLFAIADQPPPVRDPAEPSPTPLHAGIELRGLSFNYPGSLSPALERVSLVVPPGGRLAIVGPSGAGKSTLVRLLLRFWEYGGGQIWLGGHELRRYRADDARAMIGVVSQHTHLFNGSIRENLLLARPSASQAELEAAAEQAQLCALIERLPEGYDTWIGEQGLRLSGGERQRLAVARAILQDAPILILDEPSAQLDADTERELFAALEPLIARRTTILITHRAAGLFAMDAILRIEGGRVCPPAANLFAAIPSIS